MAKLHFLHWLYCVKRRAQWIWILWTDLIMIAQEHSKAPTERIHSHSSSADPELPLHHPPSIPLSIAPFIPLLIPLSNSSLSFHLRSNNISNPYFQPAIPPMAISARALEIFNTLYPQFGWVILTKFFFFFFWRMKVGRKSCAITWAHDAYWLLCFLPFLSFFTIIHPVVFFFPLPLFLPQMNRPIQVKPADSESRGGTVCNCLLLLLRPSLATFLLLFQPHKHAACTYQPHHYVSY